MNARWTPSLLVALLLGCAGPTTQLTKSPGSVPQTSRYQLQTFSFEVPNSFLTTGGGIIGLLNLKMSLPGRGGMTGNALVNGQVFAFCVERDDATCGGVGVQHRDDLSPEQCADRKRTFEWLEVTDGRGPDDLTPAPVDGHPGWLIHEAAGASQVLVICAAPGPWVVKSLTMGPKAEPYAKGAFAHLMKTARFEPAAQAAAK
ncbi:MAG: hypothetical protein QM767_21945 [Anaeromyxobacter sp.]